MTSTTDVRTRLVLAAQAEFAAYGLAGARIDRIAQAAAASKERLYAHFTDKSALFQAVLDANVAAFTGAAALDPSDVGAFVGQVFDHTQEHPDILRMLTWARLEGFRYTMAGPGSTRDVMVANLKEGQSLGSVDAQWEPEVLIPILFGVAHAWAQAPLAVHEHWSGTSMPARRAAAVEAARRIVRPGA